MTMLNGLDDIDWHNLSHAYGAADDVPGRLRDLAADDEDVRDAAMYKLYGTIWHQGTVYEATAFAVPFLLALVLDESVADRDQILALLVQLAHGNSYWDVHQHLSFFDEVYPGRKDSAEFKEEIAKELGWVRAAYLAVRKGMPVYLNLLHHADPRLRKTAAYVLSVLVDQQSFAEIVPPLLARLNAEGDEVVRASLIHGIGTQVGGQMAAGTLPPKETQHHTEFFAQLVQAEEESDLVRLVAALALATLKPLPDVYARLAADRLITMLTTRDEDLAERCRRLPWVEEDIAGQVCLCLAGLDRSITGTTVVPALLQALQATDGFTALSIAQALVHVVFREGRAAAGGEPRPLTPDQRAVLEGFARKESPCWEFNGNMGLMLRAYGLPGSPEEVQVLLGSTAV